eukprot:s625_g12.t1
MHCCAIPQAAFFCALTLLHPVVTCLPLQLAASLFDSSAKYITALDAPEIAACVDSIDDQMADDGIDPWTSPSLNKLAKKNANELEWMSTVHGPQMRCENGALSRASNWPFPWQSHTRLAILERRHQVTRRAVSIFLQANPTVAAADDDGLITALNFVVPQINRTPNVCGFNPIQWTLGCTPHIPGLLMEEQTGDNPAHLDPSQRFMEKLRLQQEAAKATAEADGDRRLRQALLRKFIGKLLGGPKH